MAVSATALKNKAPPKPKQWVWEAKTRAGEVKKGEMEARRRRRGGHAAQGARALPGQGQEEARAQLRFPQLREQGHEQGPPDLHPAVRDDDRRGPAARAVPRHPRQPDGQQVLQAGRAPHIKANVEQGVHLRRRARRTTPRSSTSSSSTSSPPARWAASSTPSSTGWRSTSRRPMKLKRQVKGAMVYPIIVHHRGHRRDGDPAPQGHSGLRQDVHRLRVGDARADPVRHRHVELARRATSSTCLRAAGHRASRSSPSTGTRRGGRSSTCSC